MRAAPRNNEGKQQQDWRLVFVDTPETFQIIDCVDELTSTKDCLHRDLLSRSIRVAACLPEIGHEVRLGRVQTGHRVGRLSECPKSDAATTWTAQHHERREVKQQQDWRLVFVNRTDTYRITDCLDEGMGENVVLTGMSCP